MKARSIGKTHGLRFAAGFSTLELIIAFAILTLVMGAVVLSAFSGEYWVIASQTSNEALYKTKTRLEELRATAEQNFPSLATSEPQKDMDEVCSEGGLCYFLEHAITNISECATYALARASWKVNAYPTTTASLFTSLTNPREVLARGGDCALVLPKEDWSSASVTAAAASLGGAPLALDVFANTAYVLLDESPYFAIVTKESGPVAFENGFALLEAGSGIDVARESATGRIYAYLAMASTTSQLQVLDVTDPAKPTLVAKRALGGANVASAVGFRIAYYNRHVFITTPFTGQPDFFVFDVSNPTVPSSIGEPKVLGTTVYGTALREEFYNGSHRTLLYAATSHSEREIMVLDVTDPENVFEVLGARTNIVQSVHKPARAVLLHGTKLYVGLYSGSGDELYIFDASETLSVSGGLPKLASLESSPRAIVALKAAGDVLFLAGINATPEVQIRNIHDLSLIKRVSVPGIGGMDLEMGALWAAGSGAPSVRIISNE